MAADERPVEILVTRRTCPTTSSPGPTTSIRLCVFHDAEDSVLVQVAKGVGPITLPPLVAPFTKASVGRACGEAGVVATVIETVPGRWTHAIGLARAAERAQRGSHQREHDALQAQAMRGSSVPAERDRAALIGRLQELPVEQRAIRAKIFEATRQRATGGVYMDRNAFQALREREASLREETIAVQARLRVVNEEMKVAQRAEHNAFANRFITAAKQALDEDTFAALVEAASGDTEDGDG